MNDFQRHVAEEYVDHYKEGQISRRGMLRRVGLITGSAALAVGFLKELGVEATVEEVMAAGPETQQAPGKNPITVPLEDPSIRTGWIIFQASDGAPIIGYLARPSAEGRYPGVLVVHENRGPTDHIQDVARRLARDGFTTLAPDLLSRAGGAGSIVDLAQIPATLSAAPPERNTMDLSAGVSALMARDDVRPGGIGAVGFCFGGGMVWRLAMADQNVTAAVPFYGPAPTFDGVPSIRGPVLAIYAGNDDRVNAGWPKMEDALNSAGATYDMVTYPGVGHAFHNDTGQNYDEQAARDAYGRTVAWFRQYLPHG